MGRNQLREDKSKLIEKRMGKREENKEEKKKEMKRRLKRFLFLIKDFLSAVRAAHT